jgi:uncharacterized protein (DUF1501 family)
MNEELTRRQALGLGIGAAGALAVGPSLIGSAVAAAAPGTARGVRAQASTNAPGILVLVTLYGGNDGLNTVVPLADSAYLAARGSLAIPSEQALKLDATRGLHPSLKGVAAEFGAGRVAIVQGVGYTSPNRSHFRSMDIWQTAAPESFEFTGWLGRWFDATGGNPLRMVHMGASTPRAFLGQSGSGSTVAGGRIVIPGGAGFERLLGEMYKPGAGAELGPFGARVASSGADQLAVKNKYGPVLASVAQTSQQYASLEGGGAANGTESGNSALARDLDAVSALIKAGSEGRVFSVQLGGFDTHAGQLDQHARLLSTLDGALTRFLRDVTAHPNGANVTVLVYSEFGRRVIANGSNGTDHGTASNMFVLGPRVKGGFHGEPSSLTALDANGDLVPTVDFRQVYAAVLGSVLGVEPSVALSKPMAPLSVL